MSATSTPETLHRQTVTAQGVAVFGNITERENNATTRTQKTKFMQRLL